MGRSTARVVLAFVLVVGGCGGSTAGSGSGSASPPPPGTELQATPAAAIDLQAPPADAADVRSRVDALVRIAAGAGVRDDGVGGPCPTVDEVAFARGPALPLGECLASDVGLMQEGQRFWALVTVTEEGGRARLHIVTGVSHCDPTVGGACEPPPDDDLVRSLRCATLDDVWQEIPAEHRRCGANEDCAFFSAAGNCYQRGIAKASIEAYERYSEQYGLPCPYAVMGACLGTATAARCEEGLCVP